MSESSEGTKSPASTQVIDACGLACPQPVVLVKKALESLSGSSQGTNSSKGISSGQGTNSSQGTKSASLLPSSGHSQVLLTVLVNDETARENVVRFVTHAGFAASVEKGHDGVTTITISSRQAAESSPEASTAPTLADMPVPSCADAPAADPLTVFFTSDRIGQGNDELGALLMKGFIYALAEGENKPVRMIFMNSGVNLTVEGSIHLENLRRLQDEGVEILSCGTCLDFYGLKDKLAVGRVSNMYEIVSLLSSGRVLRP